MTNVDIGGKDVSIIHLTADFNEKLEVLAEFDFSRQSLTAVMGAWVVGKRSCKIVTLHGQ